jgi:hypothetical protein
VRLLYIAPNVRKTSGAQIPGMVALGMSHADAGVVSMLSRAKTAAMYASAGLTLILFGAPPAEGQVIEEVDRPEEELALDLLSAALGCTSPPVKLDEFTIKWIYEFGGDLKVLGWKEQKTMLIEGAAIKNPELLTTFSGAELGSESRQTFARFAELSRIESAYIEDDGIRIKCTDSTCISELLWADEQCETDRNNTRSCWSSIDEKNTASSTFEAMFLGVCADQRDSVLLALQVLIDASKKSPAQPGTFHVEGLPPGYAVHIRQDPGTQGKILGAIAAGSREIHLTECQIIPGHTAEWCRITWGGTTGWVSTSRLKAN